MWSRPGSAITKSTDDESATSRTGFGTLVVIVALLAAVPLWIVPRPPLEDLPIHAATLRVLHSLHDPRFGLSDFRLTLGRTQYVSYYLLGDLLAHVVGVATASLLLASATLTGTVLGMRALLRALRRDERLSLLVVPLLYNPLFGLGLFPFLLGIPILLWASARMIAHVEAPTVRSGIFASALGLLLFYVHVVPFGVFAIAAVAMIPMRHRHDRVRLFARALPLAPALFAAAAWTFATDAGRQVLEAARARGTSHRLPLLDAARQLPGWICDLFVDRTDEVIFALLMALAIGSTLIAGSPPGRRATALRWSVVPVTCLMLYFALDPASGFMWPLAQRFAVIAAITAVPLCKIPDGARGRFVTHAAFGLALLSIVNTVAHFVHFARVEVGAFDAALAAIEPRSRVASLVFEAGSGVVNGNPFLHFGSYHQAEKGGVVQFSFAGYDHWPIDFRPGHYPPPGAPARPRWEWNPGLVTVAEVSPYYDYVLVRGGPLSPPGCGWHSPHDDSSVPCAFVRVFVDPRWAVWRRAR